MASVGKSVKSSKPGGRRAIAALALGVPLAAAGVLWSRNVRGRQRPGFPYFAGAPLLIAHRGGAALAPENTILAFGRALHWWGADMLELDVRPTREGEAVVLHDATLDRTTDGSGPIAEFEAERLEELDAGYHFTPDEGVSHPFRGQGLRVPTLLEVLRAFPDTRVNIEIKDGRAQAGVRRAIREAGAAGRVLVAGGRRRDRLALTDQGLPVSASADELRFFATQLRLGKVLIPPEVDALQLPLYHQERLLPDRRLVEAAHAFNIAVHVWTINEPAEMRLLLDNGVDGIMTDRPDRLARVLHDRVGRPLPPGAPDQPPGMVGAADERRGPIVPPRPDEYV